MSNGDERDDWQFEWHEVDDDAEPSCMPCGGDGFVDSVAQESGRYGWDPDEPGTCPNCRGSGLRKDQTTF